MPIKLDIQPYCENCDEFEPVKDIGITFYADNDNQALSSFCTRVFCKHEKRCKEIAKHIGERLSNETNNLD